MDVFRRAALAVAFLTTAAGTVFAQAGRGPSARWVGQDGKDFVGPHNRFEPSDVQDVHIAIAGLDPRREVKLIDVLSTERKHNQWQYNAIEPFAWKAAFVREQGSPRGDLYIEPGDYTGPRKYDLTIRYDDGREHKLSLMGKQVDSTLRTAAAAMKAAWVGQDGRDAVGPGPGVGPDGLADACIRLSGLSKKVDVRAVRIDGPSGTKWESHINPEMLPACELRLDPSKPGEGDLFFQPTRDLDGGPLAVRILYTNDTGDRASIAAGKFDPRRKAAEPPAPTVVVAEAQVKWLGQDGGNDPGDVHVAVTGVDVPRDLVAATLADGSIGSWSFRVGGDDPFRNASGWVGTDPMIVKPGGRAGTLDVFFPPIRDEAGASFSLRLIARDGRSTVIRFPGGSCDPALRHPAPAASRSEAKPGDDLQALVDQAGTVSLAAGTYRLVKPLVLNRPVVLTASQGATLVFSQPAGSPPWTTALKIHHGRTTLSGLSIRFEGPIRWDDKVGYGPAVIGTSDDRDPDPIRHSRKWGIVLSKLDVEGPPSTDPSKWVDSVGMFRFTHADGGRVEGCTLLGGSVQFFNGPWSFVDNTFRGAPAKTMSAAAISGRYIHDVLVRKNRVKGEPSGKLWRFFALGAAGKDVIVEDNVVEGVGEIDGDGVPRVNAPEIMLTESYRVGYEGAVRSVSPDGRLIRVGERQGDVPIRAGWTVAILTGPAAGTYRRLLQPIDDTTLLLDEPIPKETGVVSIVDGLTGIRFSGNSVDIRGSSTSYGLVLPGNQFGTVVERNRFMGGATGMAAGACASEQPVHWGWSHCPAIGVLIRGNTFEDACEGLTLGVQHDPKHVKSNAGRVYMSATVEDNVVRWTDAFLRRVAADRESGKRPLVGIALGEQHSRDPSELRVQAARNTLDAPAGRKLGPSFLVRAADLNGKPARDETLSLPGER
ncbi:right-handed parallel beta-helix repeat-containing protein [Paludisphaera rhizosphaerae]|uniref:hypothetical protein n=1 Tax=Paludisphaera rhizosphaerae TaxID=2711216 RepID=UPI0013ED8BD9|nr:hypothetical protein [Paludisphaera rhizosphaerae]